MDVVDPIHTWTLDPGEALHLQASLAGTPGRFGWDGGLGASRYSDPQEDRVGILVTQVAWSTPSPPNVCLDFWTSAYQAISG